MSSIAIWCKTVEVGKELLDVELHFNFWKLPDHSKAHTKFLDIGIKLPKPQGIGSIEIYFPSKVKEADFVDIISNFINDASLVSAIFNENYRIVSEGTSKRFQINNANGRHEFDIYKTSSEDVTSRDKYSGTIFSIKVPQQEKALYFRFRVLGDFIDSLSTIHRPTNAILESAFSEIEMIDFRVNENRDLDLSLLEQIEKDGRFRIAKQHFFFICSNEEEVIGYHLPYLACRNLEHSRWQKYVGMDNIDKQIFLAYHWKDLNVTDSNILIKTKYEKNNWKTIAGFVVIALVLELLGHWIFKLFGG